MGWDGMGWRDVENNFSVLFRVLIRSRNENYYPVVARFCLPFFPPQSTREQLISKDIKINMIHWLTSIMALTCAILASVLGCSRALYSNCISESVNQWMSTNWWKNRVPSVTITAWQGNASHCDIFFPSSLAVCWPWWWWWLYIFCNIYTEENGYVL